MKLYVGNLSFETKTSDLEALFSEYGRLVSAKVITDMYSGKSKGFGFVELESKRAGEGAIKDLNGKEINGRAVVINEARPQQGRR